MKKVLIYSLLSLLLIQSTLHAQNKSSNRAKAFFQLAERDYQDYRFWYAIPFYKVALEQKAAQYDSASLLHLAESYWQMDFYDSAQLYFSKYETAIGPSYFSSQRLAELAGIRTKAAEATGIYQNILSRFPKQHEQLVANRLEGFANPTRFLKDTSSYAIRFLKDNSSEQDFSPVYFQKGILFVSNRFAGPDSEKEFGWDGLPFARVYTIPDDYMLRTLDTMPVRKERDQKINIIINDDYTPTTSNDNNIRIDYRKVERTRSLVQPNPLSRFSDQFSSLYNYGSLCFNQSETKLYFTRNSLKANTRKHHLEICEATLDKAGWVNVRVLAFVDNDYDYFHPALSKDEKRLYFSSNQPGGKGGADLYYFSLHPDSAKSNPVLLDDRINTEGDELFPTIAGDTLFFCSNGLPGLGGLDLFAIHLSEKGISGEPKNVGAPLNSSYDDFGLIWKSDKRKGLFSSNRLGSDDIFTIDLLKYPIKVTGSVFDAATEKELTGVRVLLKQDEPTSLPDQQMLTELYGAYRFEGRSRQSYTLYFTKEGYYNDSIKVYKDSVINDLQIPALMMRPIPPPPPAPKPVDTDGDGIEDALDKCPDLAGLVTNNGCPEIQKKLNELAKLVFFETDKDVLTKDAYTPLDEAVKILLAYPQTTLIIEGHTDNVAGKTYNLNLSQRRASRVKNYLISKGIVATRFTKVVGYGMEQPIAENASSEGRAQNRRVYIKAQFYE
jgi:outer membrane protein OmpA-like peptidoglycan-associated protein